LIDAHPAGDEIRGFAQRFQEKAAQSIPGQDAQRVISGREGFGPEPNEPDAAEEQPGHFQKLHGDAPPAHAAGVVQPHAAPAARFPAAATAIERAAEPRPEAARENAGANEIPEDARGNVEQPRGREGTGSHREERAEDAPATIFGIPHALTGVLSKIERVVNEQVIRSRAGQADDRERERAKADAQRREARRLRDGGGHENAEANADAEKHLEGTDPLPGEAKIPRITQAAVRARRCSRRVHVSVALDSHRKSAIADLRT